MNGVIAWPIIPMRNVRTDILPLFPGGASSPTYVETRLRSAPTPIPVRNLHSASVTIPVEAASPNDPTAVSTIVIIIRLNLPYLSDSAPIMKEPNMYPIKPIESAMKRLSEPVSPNWVAIAGIANPMSVMS